MATFTFSFEAPPSLLDLPTNRTSEERERAWLRMRDRIAGQGQGQGAAEDSDEG